MILNSPEISVIIPTYNRHHLIKETLDSVLCQTFTNYEIIVVDDASTNGTADWIETNYPQVKLIRLIQNQGCAAARNVGVGVASGNLIAFLDHDDQWLPNYLEIQVKALAENPNAVLAYCNYKEKHDNGFQIDQNCQPWRIYPDFIQHLLMQNCIPSMSITLIKSQALIKAGVLNETLQICNDRELYLRLLYFGNIVHVPETLIIKNFQQNNLSKDYWLWSKEVLTLLDIFFSDERSKPYQHLDSEARSHWMLKLAKTVWQSNRDLVFVTYMLMKAIYFSPQRIKHAFLRRIGLLIATKN